MCTTIRFQRYFCRSKRRRRGWARCKSNSMSSAIRELSDVRDASGRTWNLSRAIPCAVYMAFAQASSDLSIIMFRVTQLRPAPAAPLRSRCIIWVVQFRLAERHTLNHGRTPRLLQYSNAVRRLRRHVWIKDRG